MDRLYYEWDLIHDVYLCYLTYLVILDLLAEFSFYMFLFIWRHTECFCVSEMSKCMFTFSLEVQYSEHNASELSTCGHQKHANKRAQ